MLKELLNKKHGVLNVILPSKQQIIIRVAAHRSIILNILIRTKKKCIIGQIIFYIIRPYLTYCWTDKVKMQLQTISQNIHPCKFIFLWLETGIFYTFFFKLALPGSFQTKWRDEEKKIFKNFSKNSYLMSKICFAWTLSENALVLVVSIWNRSRSRISSISINMSSSRISRRRSRRRSMGRSRRRSSSSSSSSRRKIRSSNSRSNRKRSRISSSSRRRSRSSRS